MKASVDTIPIKLSDRIDEQIIVEKIYKAVMEQRLAPNTKLSEADLCDIFGVGRMKVRRALLLLSSQGIVDLHSNRGAYVACPNAKEAKEVFDARLHIEPSIVEKIALSHTKLQLKKLQDHINLEKQAKKSGNRPEIIRLSGEFHVELIAVSENDFLTRIMRELVTRTSLIVGMFGTGQGMSCREDEHEKILHQIKKGESEKAKNLVNMHLTHIQDGVRITEPAKGNHRLSSILLD